MNNDFCANEANDGVSVRVLQEMEQWDKQEVGCWLMTIGGFCIPMVEKCYNNNIDGHLLVKLLTNEATLVHEYGLNKHQASIFVDYLMEDKHEVKKEVNLCNKVELARCDSKQEGVTSIVQEWTYEHVCLWLLATGGQKLSMLHAFFRNQVNGTQLLELTADQLTAWGYPTCDVDSFLKRRDEIKDNGFCFKESFHKLFVRRRRSVIARDEPERDMDSVSLDGSDTSSLSEADSYEPYESLDPCHYVDESVGNRSFDEKRVETDNGIVVVGDIRRDESDSEDMDDVVTYVGDIRRDESLTAGENVQHDVDIIEPNQRVAYDEKFDDAEEVSETVGVYIAVGDGLIKAEETKGEFISLSPISVPHIDERNKRIMKAVREAEENETPGGELQDSSSVEKQTKGEIISLSPISVPHIDGRNKRIMKVVREAEEDETPGGDVQDASQSKKQKQIDAVQKIPTAFHQSRKIRDGEPGEPNLQEQIQSAQTIPRAYRIGKQKQQTPPDEQFFQQNVNQSEQVELQEQPIRIQKRVSKQSQLPGENPLSEEFTIQVLETQEQAVVRDQVVIRNRKQTLQQTQAQNPEDRMQSTENQERAVAKTFKAFQNRKQIQPHNTLQDEEFQVRQRKDLVDIQEKQDQFEIREQKRSVQISQQVIQSQSEQKHQRQIVDMKQQKFKQQHSFELQQNRVLSDETRVVQFSQEIIRSRNRTEQAQIQNTISQDLSAQCSENRIVKVCRNQKDEFQEQQYQFPPDANQTVKVSQHLVQPRNQTERTMRQVLQPLLPSGKQIQRVKLCEDAPQKQDRIPRDAVQDFQQNITEQCQNQQILKIPDVTEQDFETQSKSIRQQKQQSIKTLLQSDGENIQLDHSRRRLQIQSDAHVHRINVQSFEEQLQLDSQVAHQKQTQEVISDVRNQTEAFMSYQFEDVLNLIFGQRHDLPMPKSKNKLGHNQLQNDFIPVSVDRQEQFRLQDIQKASQFSTERDIWNRDTLKAKQYERTDQISTNSQHNYPLQEFMQIYLNLQSQEVEQDLFFMQSQYYTATWLLLACAATTLDLKESSKTPGGFGSCQAEMVRVVQATVQSTALC